MKKICVLLSGLMLSAVSAHAVVKDTVIGQGIAPPVYNHVQPVDRYVNYAALAQAERTILGRTFEHQNVDVRLNRLERNVFRRTHPELPYDQRINNVLNNYNRDIAGNLSGGGWRNVLGNFIMGGVPTGATPPLHWGMDPYSMGFIDQRGAGGDAGYYTGNRGWGYSNNSVGSRTGVTILD
jgi:hypothetical protein